MKLKVVSTGHEGWQMKVVDAATGQELENVASVTWTAEITGDITTSITLYNVELEVHRAALGTHMATVVADRLND